MEGWLTPDIGLLSSPLVCRTIVVPGDLWYLVTGALEPLTRDYFWEEHGTATPDDMSQLFRQIVDDYANSECDMGFNPITTQWDQLYYKSSGNSDPATLHIPKTDLPAEAASAKLGLFYMFYSGDKDMNIQYQTEGNKATGNIFLEQPTGNRGIQFLCPLDDTGGKIILSATGGLSNWSYYLFLVGWF